MAANETADLGQFVPHLAPDAPTAPHLGANIGPAVAGAPTVHVPRLGKLLHKPEPYDGKDRSKCQTFISQVKLYISGNADIFPDDDHKVLFAATYLRDKAFTWFEPRMNKLDDPILHNFNAFCDALLHSLGDPELKKTMMRKLKGLKQTSSVANYRTEIQSVAQYLTIGEDALKEYFYDGLRDSVKDVIADLPADFEPVDFDSFKSWCVRIDSRQYDRKLENKGDNSGSRDHGRSSPRSNFPRVANVQVRVPRPAPVSTTYNGPQPMDLDATRGNKRFKPLTPDERKRRYDNNLCLYCGKAGHRAGDCPEKRKTGGYSKGRINATLLGPSDQQLN